jgi:uncharacterized protein
MFISRQIIGKFKDLLEYFPAVAILGPRQVGKTTLVREYFKNQTNIVFLDLEIISDLDKLNDPELFLKRNEDKTIIIDEVQRKPELFPLLRALIDQKRVPGRFVILGSATPALIKQSSESLAGRLAYLELFPIGYNELPKTISQDDLWFRGGFPNSLLAPTTYISNEWKRNFIKSYVERDLILLGMSANSLVLERLWIMLANLNGQILNYSVISNSLGIAVNTVKNYLDFFESAFLIKRLYPFSFNLNKRLVKSPKVYILDTGILHGLLRIESLNDLYGNSLIGASWENFVIFQIFQLVKHKSEIYFYKTHAGAECDLVIVKGLQPIISIEIKFSSTPGKTRGTSIAFEDLKTQNNFIITPASDDYLLKNNIRVCNLQKFLSHYIPELLGD